MSIALYGEHGFYSGGGRAGRRGDFITSPEVGPLFGTVLGRAIDDGRGGFAEVLSAALDPVPDVLPVRPAHGARAPLLDAAAAWVAEAVGLLATGAVVAVDYTFARTAEAAAAPWRDWLRTYRGHERGGHYLADPGSQDITTQVCLDQLPAASAVRPQAQFLRRWGIDEL